MGDLNCNESSVAYQVLLSNGLRDTQAIAEQTVDVNTHHPYPEYDDPSSCFFGAPLPVGGYAKAIDHLLVDSENSQYISLFSVLVDEKSLNTSDHCPIMADFDDRPTMRIGLFTDAHESDKPLAAKTRRPDLSFEKIRVAMEDFQCKKVDLVICLGDLLDHCVDQADEEREFRRLSEMIRSFDLPFYCVRGNHDCINFLEEDFYRISKFDLLPFCKRYGDRALIFLNTCYHEDGTPYVPGHVEWTNSALMQDQLEKLQDTLADSSISEAIVFLHQRLYPDDNIRYKIRNSEEIRAVLEKSGKVKRVYCGHYHHGSTATRNGITYFTLPAMCEGERNSFEVIEF